MSQQAIFERALKKLNVAPFDSSCWPSILEDLALATGSRASQMIGWSGATETAVNITSEEWRGLGKEWFLVGGGDPMVDWLYRPATKLREGSDFTEYEVLSEIDKARNPVFNDFHVKNDMPHLCLHKLLDTSTSQWSLTAGRSKHQGPLEAHDRRLFRTICRAATVAMKNTHLMKDESARLVAKSFEATSVAAFVCNSFGRVIAMSHLAEEFSLRHGAIEIRNNTLHARFPELSGKLETAIAMAARAQISSTPIEAVPLRNINGKVIAQAQAVRLPQEKNEIGLGAAVLVIITENVHQSLKNSAEAARLTDAERDVAGFMISGKSPEEIAELRRVSIATVRTQAKTIYAKLEVSGQKELMAAYRGP